MKYITQGTVQVEINDTEEAVVVINPAQDYEINHGENGYIVFMVKELPKYQEGTESKPVGSLSFCKTASFRIAHDKVTKVLMDAALKGTKIELEIDYAGLQDADPRVVAVKIPAMPKL